MRGARLVASLLLLPLLLAGCWDRIEVEDQLFLITVALDQGEVQRYRVTARAAVFASKKTGVLGGQAEEAPPSQFLAAEADSLAQAVYIMNSSVSRRISMRHIRTVIVGEALAREGLQHLWAELVRNPEIRATAGFHVARGRAAAVLKQADWTAEYNPGRVGEGILLVEKQLHMSPPIRIHHMVNRTSAIGVQPYASVLAINPLVTGEETELSQGESAIAGALNRLAGNPVEIAGTAIFRDSRLAGFLTIDETQALLALRGEMGKAYITIPNPFLPDQTLMLRFQQENLPQYRAQLTEAGPRVHVRILFEGEVLSGSENYRFPEVREAVEESARTHFVEQMREVLGKLRGWEADPVGFGLLFRGRFPTWSAWNQFNWVEQIEDLQVEVEAEMRIRRHGLILGGNEE